MPAANNPESRVEHVTIDTAHAGQRIDNYLITWLKGVPRTHVYRLLRKGEVRVNKGRAKPDYRLQAGDVVRIPPVRRARRSPDATASGARLDWLGERIIYEDKDLLVIDKPAGMAVHGGSEISLGLIDALRALRPELSFLQLAHRLDRETSGCLLLAKNREALLALHDALREGRVDKRYVALVKGYWAGGAREVDMSLEKGRLQSGERVSRVAAEGKESISRFRPKQAFAKASVVEIQLLTGRTHQARVHAAHLGHPIAGDDKYGDAGFNRELRPLGLRRLFLHAASLSLQHPKTRARLQLHAPLPPELQNVIKQLKHG